MINVAPLNTRQTKYCDAIKVALLAKGHSTNNELLIELRKSFPELSATTVHRVTTRLAMRYDANIKPHDHFLCNSCDLLRDTDARDKITPILEASIGDCQISGRLTISGVCRHCIKLNRKEYV
jgi:Fur family peroxide stress response transcriptional regulator